MRIPTAHRRSSKVLSFIAGLALTIIIWAFDYLVLGPAITLTLMYLIPIAWVTWYSGRTSGIVLALISTAGWFTVYATQNPYFSHIWINYLNVIMKIALYLAYAVVFDALHTSLKKERSLSRTDPLTGAANRRAFMDILQFEKNLVNRNGRPLTVAFFDIDNFKEVNDTFGHAAGDKLLRLTARTISQSLRITDTVGRMGGDEFAILLPEIDAPGAETAVDKIQRRLRDMARENGWAVTFSFGVVTCTHPHHSAESLVAAADRAMYMAKQAGKNRTRHAGCDGLAAGKILAPLERR